MLLVGLPLLGAGVDEAFGPGVGVAFAVCAVCGAAAAAAVSGRAGWWWVLPAVPPVVLAATAAAELAGNPAAYPGWKETGTGAVRWAVNGFPVMVAALAAAGAVVLVRLRRAAVRRAAGRRAEGARRG